MIVRLIKKSKIYNFTLPTEIAGNYWIKDNDYLGNERNLINVEEENGQWKIKSDFETKIMNGDQEISSAILREYSLYFLKINTDNEYVILYCSPTMEPSTVKLRMKNPGEILIGNDSKATICYEYPLVSKEQARLIYNGGSWTVQDLNSKYGTYVNNKAITSQTTLEYGDIVFIMGLKIIVMEQSIIINNIGNFVRFDNTKFDMERPIVQTQHEFDNPDEEGIEFYKEEDYFFRAPRFKTRIEPVNITIDPPPGSAYKEDETPAIYSLGPMITMGFSSMSAGFTALMNVINGTQDFSDVSGQVISAGAMLSTMFIWPTLNKRYQKRKAKKDDKERNKKYRKYIKEKHEKIVAEMKIQTQILIDNYLPIASTREIISSKKRNLWEREIDQEDFLDLRLGIGSTELKGTINCPTESFSLDCDELLKEVYKIKNDTKILENVPVSLSFAEKNISAIIGSTATKQQFIDGLVLQMLTYHSYEDLKIVVFTTEKNSSNWEYLKIAPHCWSNDHMIRFYASNKDEAKEVSLVLEKEVQARKYTESSNGEKELSTIDYKQRKPYYVIITDDYKEYRDIELIKDIAESKLNIGFSLIVISPRLINIPNECKAFISLGDKKSGIFENELVSNKQKEFVADYDPTLNMYECAKLLANIPIDIAKQEQSLPKSVTFLEMYNVGMVEQLNILSRWKNNDPTKTLQAPVGLDKSRELFKLDLHEKFHGPHGLVAGMTGSGKSEFIVTYIASMAINYHPYEVSFVLIDYKGGGLAGVFQNKETGMKLPHLAGTITNLDTNEMNRSLASIQSELRKRQRMFNEARDALNESSIDIYKYQGLFRKGKVKKPISHLFIISDEFAELKAQRPEFMEQLISTARIGRSLGVHLILATQKPSGVVDDQIWSNSKFRVCLKVQDKSDSMDMIKCPDAASIKQAGRFYLQVGYNELFAMGQAAWGGAQYYPTEKRKKKVDQSVTLIDNVGNVLKVLDTDNETVAAESKGEEITSIIQYIVNEAKQSNIVIDQLWLEKIPDVIYTDALAEKYNYVSQKNVLNPIIGEYDDPNNQKQGLFTLPLSQDGNTIIYGVGGSGKEMLITSMIYSIITNHTSDEVNFYLLDFGAETLRVFNNAPHVGDILLSSDKDKIENLFKMLLAIIEERKNLFVDYNGSYEFYISHGGKQIPQIIVVINNVETFLETYPDYEDAINQMTRDCLKYGVIFVLTTNGTNTVRYRTRQNFSQNVCLQFNDPGDYSNILPGARKIEPSKIYGRGLIEREAVYEFQTAYSYKEEKISDYIKIICKKLQAICPNKAKKIPILPEVVTTEFVESKLGNIRTIPVGVEKEALTISTIDLSPTPLYIVTGDDITANPKFIHGLAKHFLRIPNAKSFILDSALIFEEYPTHPTITYGSDKCNDAVNKLLEIYDAKVANNTTEPVLAIITGLSGLLGKLEEEQKTKFTQMLEGIAKLGTIKIVVVDSIDAIKGLNYESWFKALAQLSEGIWMGNGISNQFTLKVTTNARLLRAEIDETMGYVIKKGKAVLIKLASDE